MVSVLSLRMTLPHPSRKHVFPLRSTFGVFPAVTRDLGKSIRIKIALRR
jgi:hypothetical protein